MLRHEVIPASAGSGKTYKLATRYITLLTRDVNPGRILALSFTRKAAAEMFEKIIQRLAAAATDAEEAKTLAEETGSKNATMAYFTIILKNLINNMNQARISTIDSFFSSILKSFTFEYGLGGNFEILDEHQRSTLNEKVFRQVLSSNEMNKKQLQEFMEAFKMANFGQENKNIFDKLIEFRQNNYPLFLEAPNEAQWGNAQITFPHSTIKSHNNKSHNNWQALADQFLHEFLAESTEIDESRRKIIEHLSDYFANFTAATFNQHKTTAEETLKKHLIKNYEHLKTGFMTLTFQRKKIDLTEKDCAIALKIIDAMKNDVFLSRLHATKGIYHILCAYHAIYEKTVTKNGKLAFEDILFLLHGGSGHSFPLLTQNTTTEERYLDIQFRLDGTFDHWLIDEFQDTSLAQWKVFENLVDEILQSHPEERSFFYVGDVKQAIFSWRGGEQKLFNQIYEQYGKDVFLKESLSTSRRSCPQIISLVNQVFGHLNKVEGLPRIAVQKWNHHWEEHTSQVSFKGGGYAAVYSITEKKGEDKTAQLCDPFIQQLKNIDPFDKGLTSALLVRTNQQGIDFSQYLRAQGIPAIWEGDQKISEDPVVRLFLSVVKLAEHPADTFSKHHLLMSPLKHYLMNCPIGNRSEYILALISKKGFEGLINQLFLEFSKHATIDDYSKIRLNELRKAAKVFDSSDSLSCFDFIKYVSEYSLAATATPSAVSVMTIHKSKGLGFDIVLLPLLTGASASTKSTKKSGDIIKKETDANIDWIFMLPDKGLSQIDSILSQELDSLDSNSTYDQFCNLYVSLTRPKKALFISMFEQKSNSKAIYSSTILRDTLADCATQNPQLYFEEGHANWYTSFKTKGTEESKKIATKITTTKADLISTPFSPSSKNLETDLELFKNHSNFSLKKGSAVHQLFEAVTWLNQSNIADIAKIFKTTSPYSEIITHSAINDFHNSLKNADIAKMFLKEEHTSLWQEKSFDVLLEGKWYSGVFDRVTIKNDEKNNILSARIIDFKTDKIACQNDLNKAIKKHSSQMLIYKESLAKILQLDKSKIETILLFTSNQTLEIIE